MNDNLRQALIDARLREEDVAARLAVDPKTVRRWLEGRVPYPANRGALADLLGANESELWPEAAGPLIARTRPEELRTVYPHRWAIPRDTWARFFASAEHEIGILAYSALFLAEDAGLLRILADRGRQGVKLRIALGDPNSSQVAQRGIDEGIGDAMPAKVRNALALFRPLAAGSNVQIRLHTAILYSSLYRSDNSLLVNQHIYGIPASQAITFTLSRASANSLAEPYLQAFNKIWDSASAGII